MIDPGLCAGCVHGRAIRSDRGSVFWLCRRSATDSRFPRYPSLPVLACAGFEPAPAAPAASARPLEDAHDGDR